MDVQENIDELRELVEKNIAIAEETNRIVRGMRRSARLGRLFQVVWWLLIAIVSAVSYYYYVEPYVAKIEQLYGMTEQQGQTMSNEVTNILKYFTPHATSTRP